MESVGLLQDERLNWMMINNAWLG